MGIKILSLFDGMSCGQIALQRAGIEVDNYFASEIKPHAIKVTQHNFPDTIQLGDVRNVKVKDLPSIDLLIGGSPCKDLSQANKTKAGLMGDSSGLFYEYLRLLRETNPTYFFLENVVMDKEWQNIITNTLGVEPVLVNSSLVSAQMRKRLYWTNIPGFTMPADRGIRLKDIITDGYVTKDKAYCLLESESRPQKTNWKRFRRWRKKGFVNIVFERPDLNLFHNRILNQTELERLQNIPEGYTEILTRDEAASLIGDGWTVDVIVEFFKPLANLLDIQKSA